MSWKPPRWIVACWLGAGLAACGGKLEGPDHEIEPPIQWVPPGPEAGPFEAGPWDAGPTDASPRGRDAGPKSDAATADAHLDSGVGSLDASDGGAPSVDASSTPIVVDGVVAATLQTCTGDSTPLAPGAQSTLTCDVVSPLGGDRMLVVPEMFVPGNGCIVTVDKPRVVMVGNNFGVSATFENRCGSTYAMSEGGLGWMIYELGANAGAPVQFTGVASGSYQSCRGAAALLAPNATQTLTCDVVSALGGDRMLIAPEMIVPGDGCIVADTAPRVVMVGNNFGVTTTLRNRCGANAAMSEGGLGWMIYERAATQARPLALTGIAGGAAHTCAGPSTYIAHGATTTLTCGLSSALPGNQLFATPEMYVPGNGCFVPTTKPRLTMIGNDLGVSATFTNRCFQLYMQSEGGLGWISWRVAP